MKDTAGERTKEYAESAAEKARQAKDSMADTAREYTGSAADKARQTREVAERKTREYADTTKYYAGSAAEKLGKQKMRLSTQPMIMLEEMLIRPKSMLGPQLIRQDKQRMWL